MMGSLTEPNCRALVELRNIWSTDPHLLPDVEDSWQRIATSKSSRYTRRYHHSNPQLPLQATIRRNEEQVESNLNDKMMFHHNYASERHKLEWILSHTKWSLFGLGKFFPSSFFFLFLFNIYFQYSRALIILASVTESQVPKLAFAHWMCFSLHLTTSRTKPSSRWRCSVGSFRLFSCFVYPWTSSQQFPLNHPGIFSIFFFSLYSMTTTILPQVPPHRRDQRQRRGNFFIASFFVQRQLVWWCHTTSAVYYPTSRYAHDVGQCIVIVDIYPS